MNDTEQLFLAAGVWALIAGVISSFISAWPGRIAFFTIAVGLPFWELPYGYYNFQKLCDEEGSLRVFEAIAPQESLCIDYPFETVAEGMLTKGFVSVEAREKGGGVTRHRKTASGDINIVKTESVVSEYCVTRAFVRSLPWRTMRNELTVVRNSDTRVVARHSDFVWFGMWWQEAALPVLGRGGECRFDGFGSVATALLAGSK